MRTLNKVGLFLSTILAVSALSIPDANAQRRFGSRGLGGDMALGIGLSTVSAGQDDLNGAIDDAVDAGASIKNLGSAWEFYVNWSYRFSGTIYAFVFRPSYFMQKTDGSSPSGSYDYNLTGYTVFPIFRLYPLENSFIKFYMQTGLGYGSLSGEIKAAGKNLEFKGSAFGAMGGIGAEFCFTAAHCLTVEGNLRYMPIERNLTTGGNCSTGSDIPGISQCGGSSEVERGGSDLKTTMSGVQGLIGYTMNF
ncbi:MAG: outer membrane beta-barrel protein [Bdellovibrio sp.]